jgi:hypothetical protein
MTQGSATIQSLLGDAVRETANLAQKEFALFRAEMNHNTRLLIIGVGMMFGATVFAVAALILFTKALVDWLATVVGSEALSALIVGLVMAAITAGLVILALQMFKKFSVMPTRTIQSVKRDTEVISERLAHD